MEKKIFILSKTMVLYVHLGQYPHSFYKSVRLKVKSHQNPPSTPFKSFTVRKIQILISRVIAGKTGKSKRYTDGALKKEQKPHTKCNVTI